MAQFDITVAAGKAYTTIWEERTYLARMAMVPILLKIICVLAVVRFAEDGNLLQITLIMLPAYFAEGWMLAHLVRLVILGNRWPFQLTGDDKADAVSLNNRARGILSGMVSFVLINMVIVSFFTFFRIFVPLDIDPEQADPATAGIAFIVLLTAFFGFKFVWFYVPLAVNMNPKLYLHQFKKLPMTFYLIGLWLVCIVPAKMLMQLITSTILESAGVDSTQEALPVITENSVAVIRVIFDSLKNLFITAGIAYALLEIFGLSDPREAAKKNKN